MQIGVVDFFSGCGGASHGFLQAGINGGIKVEVVAGIDNDPHCCATYERMIGSAALQLDILGLSEDSNRLDALIRRWDLDQFDHTVLIGCAPCQGFAAHRKAIEGTDERRSLFAAFCRIAARIRPSAIFMENVPDIFSKRHWNYFSDGQRQLESAGYHVKSRIYNFAGFGLPQERFRAVVLAFPHEFPMPEPLIPFEKYRTVREAISYLPALDAGESSASDPMHVASKHRSGTVEILKQIPRDGGNRPRGVGPACLDRARQAYGGYTDVYGRLAWDSPSVTITARCRTPSCGRFVHPEQHRGLSIREAALLQGFPSEFQFEGPFDDKYKQIGNAVPPIVAEEMARHVFSLLLSPEKRADRDDPFEIREPVGPGFAVQINGIKRRRLVNV